MPGTDGSTGLFNNVRLFLCHFLWCCSLSALCSRGNHAGLQQKPLKQDIVVCQEEEEDFWPNLHGNLQSSVHAMVPIKENLRFQKGYQSLVDKLLRLQSSKEYDANRENSYPGLHKLLIGPMSVHGEAGFWNLTAAAEETAWPPSLRTPISQGSWRAWMRRKNRNPKVGILEEKRDEKLYA